jgi:hypothetical protein
MNSSRGMNVSNLTPTTGRNALFSVQQKYCTTHSSKLKIMATPNRSGLVCITEAIKKTFLYQNIEGAFVFLFLSWFSDSSCRANASDRL